MPKSVSYSFLFIALAALLASLGFRYFLVNTKDYNEYTQEVRKKVDRELEVAEIELTELEEAVIQNYKKLDFSLITSNTGEYPIYIFRNSELLFWTDNTYLLSYDQLKNNYSEYTIETPKGLFLVKQKIIVTKYDNMTGVVLIPLSSEYKIYNQFLSLGVNPKLFSTSDISLQLTPEGSSYRVYGTGSNLLFALIFPSDYSWQSSQNYTVLFFMIVACIFVFLQARVSMLYFLRNGQVWYAFFVLVSMFVGIRFLMLFLELPNSVLPTILFNARYYASSFVAPSLGDLLLNVICLFIISSFLFVHFSELSHMRSIGNRKRKRFGVVIVIVLSFAIAFYHFFNLRNLYIHSPQISLDFTRELDFSLLKITALCIGILTATTYFLLIHVLVRFIEWLRVERKKLIVLVFVGILVGWLVSGIYAFSVHANLSDAWIALIHTIYILVVIFVELPRSERSFTYQIFIYIFLGAITTSIMSSYIIYCFEQSREKIAKENFADQILLENDLQGEFLLNDVVESLPYDPIIKNRLMTSFTTKDIISRKIRKFYLDYYFDKYDIKVHLFNGNGMPYDNTMTFDEMYSKYAQPNYATEYKDIFLVHDLATNTKRYFVFSEISRSGVKIGKIVLELQLKKIVSNSVYPNLLSDNPYSNYNRWGGRNAWSYAIFENKQPVYTQGNFVYSKDFLNNFDSITTFSTSSYKHFLVKENHNKAVIISSVKYPLKSILTNFSMQFICIVLTMLFFLAIYRLYFRQQPFTFNLTGKIQLYLNLAFFLPTILLSILIVSILNSENKNQTVETYFQKAENVAQNFSNKLTSYVVYKEITKDELLESLQEIARLTQTEINVFDRDGVLLASSQPTIYDNGLVSSLINPKAMALLIEQKQSKAILSESIGKLDYNSAYVVVNSPITGEIVGVIDVPFFESQRYADEQILEVVSTMLNVFTGIFLLLVVLSFFASRDLTKPLSLVTSRLKRITLSGDNKPLDYKSDDEIGLLVGEYNKMLVKLEESKAALATSEKESAWREMAKQVAHEIKNPLTPMKLTLQHLQRVLANEESPAERSIKSLLTQVDTLSDIATSFSAFAKMPIPKTERFDVSMVLQETLILYKNDGSVRLDAIIDQGAFYVNGDAKMMGRIFTNLILNGIQAVEDKDPHINVVLEKTNQKSPKTIIIYIRDNGKGIDDEAAKKLFIPNFTTKSTGSGIGLSVAKRGIEHAGGKIWFETEHYFGTTFFIELPLVE
ncbi:histidine kinase,HAMP domain-containing protein,histidine kinase [Bernardetia litoralis DSM 6794]|uniref:histidine kinase n=1 Tax=Bernardetia litoralis (strain ATCC 23117 / DSM 6794 / NBRC 15988 / NCIMB 1366 / Fx l1 / Sio-4) TaxID=880071 RepID=I4AK53_BERLS|nr:ATP-binding protein [Bernardetia litoralis]AFM04338.1 histidine kinase,HAMP domain-containing protein,histidine kinase [Bernardetia litoralis DSM 6794]